MPIYLALGDSIAFGFDPLVAPETDAARGYPTQVAGALSRTLVDASCPGETSSGFIAGTGFDNGCREFRGAHPLHAAYRGTQLDFATDFLGSHPHTSLVSVGIGINDVLRCVRVTDGCSRALAPTLETYRADLNTILRRLRAVYDGELVLVGYYSPDYRSPRLTAAVQRLNAVMAEVARAYRARVADTFTAFAADAGATGGDICAAGLLIRLVHSCDVHPSARGGELLAATVIRTVQAAGPRGSASGTPSYGIG
jgi:lysophospholipase L1-like esterase